jgi:hypothetical protein
MDKETKDIIQRIATIQVEALTNILNNFDNLNPSEYDMLKDLLCIIPESREEVLETIQNRIQGYQDIIRYPNLIKAIDEQQLYICSHILFQMEEEWLLDNSQGVYGAWAILFKESYKFHPELTLIWYYGKK